MEWLIGISPILLIALLCPLLMIFMMRGMHGGHGDVSGHAGHDGPGGAVPGPEERLRELEKEIGELKQQVARTQPRALPEPGVAGPADAVDSSAPAIPGLGATERRSAPAE